jgi:hypothetical protein
VTTTLSRPTGSATAREPDPVGVEPRRRRPRNLPMALTAGLCMVVSIVAFVGLHLATSERRPVLALGRDVPAGSVITDADLAVANVAEDPALATIALADRETVVGQTAAVDLRAGTLLTQSGVGSATTMAAGEALVGVEVQAAGAPAATLRPGDTVRVIDVDVESTGTQKTITDGRILTVSSGATAAATTQLSLIVSAEKAPAVASASVNQRVAVVVLP